MNASRCFWYTAVVAVLAIGTFGCAAVDSDGSLLRARRERQANVAHVVVFWLKQPGDAQARQRIIEASKGLKTPGLVSVEAGEALRSPRPNVDKTYDVVVFMWFRDRNALEEYQTSDAHRAVLEQVGPLVGRTVVYDFTPGEAQ